VTETDEANTFYHLTDNLRDVLRAELDFLRRAAADRLAEDERYLTGWKDARDQAAKSLYGMVGDGAGSASKAIFACAEIIREMQP
jgi:hypothetical protein